MSNPRDAVKGTVEVLLRDRMVGLGIVLNGDGRILTSLSPLERGIGLTVRYADGSTAKVRVSHTDRTWELALLSPEHARWTTGLLASSVGLAEAGSTLSALRRVGNAMRSTISLPAGHREILVGTDGVMMDGVFTFQFDFKPVDWGGPVLDAAGNVAAILVSACDPATATHCRAVTCAVPASEIKRFLREVPATSPSPMPWLGIRVETLGQTDVRGVRVMEIEPGSPASALGLRAGKRGHILLALDGMSLGSPEDLAELLGRHRAHDRVTLFLLADGRYQEVAVTLGVPPPAPTQSRPPQGSRNDLGY